MKNKIQSVILVGFAIFFTACNSTSTKKLDQYALIPLPETVTNQQGALPITSLQTLSTPQENSYLAQEITAFLQTEANLRLAWKSQGDLRFSLDKSLKGSEYYEIKIQTTGIDVRSASDEGLYRAWQTLKQLILLADDATKLPTGLISDQPTYSYRGAMLDVARHFFSISEVKRFIDFLALYKFNYLHLHLSDDQGWRIEIKSWPQLTTIGGQSEVGGTTGGFYSQKDYQDLVAYASDRYITIIPEIDMPGHTNAALNAYPELNCDGKVPPVHTGIEVGFSSLCIEKPVTYQFVDDVIRELADITPGPYIHIGGDETHATPNDQFIAFIDSILPKVERYGKTPMGWFETRASNYTGKMVHQYWANEGNEPQNVKKGNPIVMSPSSFAYMDMQYDSLSKFGLHWAGYINVRKAYDWDPKSVVPSLPLDDIIGLETPLWSETISDNKEMDYLLFPRLIGYAEIAWTRSENRAWEAYKKRVTKHLDWLQTQGVIPYDSPLLKAN